MGGMAGLGKQVQKMQEEMLKAQEELAEATVEVTAGGGAITIVITGHQHVKSIKILPEVIDSDDPEMLQDLLVAAINNAVERSQLMAAQRMEGITGGLNIPGLGF
jgi:DNA-binding YbaB/EbfC family protein